MTAAQASLRLAGKVCLITGTGGSIGRAAAVAFAREGALVVGCDVNVAAAEATAEMIRGQGGRMVSLQPCHLTEPSECQALVDVAVRAYGRIDVLFNNAAMAHFNWLEDITDEEWNRDLRPPELQDTSLPGAYDGQGGNHRYDAATRDGGERPRYSCEFHLPWLDRNQSDARAAEGPRMGERDARQNAARTSRQARGSGERCA